MFHVNISAARLGYRMTGEINQNNHLWGPKRPAGPVIYSPGTLLLRLPALGYSVYIYIYIRRYPVANRNVPSAFARESISPMEPSDPLFRISLARILNQPSQGCV